MQCPHCKGTALRNRRLRIASAYFGRCVLIDVDTLRTLPDRELASGLSEVVKYGLIRDPALFAWLEANMERLLQRDAEVLARWH